MSYQVAGRKDTLQRRLASWGRRQLKCPRGHFYCIPYRDTRAKPWWLQPVQYGYSWPEQCTVSAKPESVAAKPRSPPRSPRGPRRRSLWDVPLEAPCRNYVVTQFGFARDLKNTKNRYVDFGPCFEGNWVVD